MNYGYLEPKDPTLGEFRTKDDLIRGIKQLQQFAGLQATGTIDEETVKLIKKPRCSMPDVGPSDRMRRRKRYALHDSRWKKLVSCTDILRLKPRSNCTDILRLKPQSNEDESGQELQLFLAFNRQLSSTLIDFGLVQILKRVDES